MSPVAASSAPADKGRNTFPTDTNAFTGKHLTCSLPAAAAATGSLRLCLLLTTAARLPVLVSLLPRLGAGGDG